MKKDIFTLRELAQPGREHVLPSLLGGRLVRRDLIEQEINNLFGSTLEPELVDAFKFLLNALKFSSRRGKTAGYRLEPSDDEKRVYRLVSGLKPERRDVGITETVVGGQTHVHITARDEAEARRLLEAAQRKYGQLDSSTVTGVRGRKFAEDQFSHRFSIGGPLQLRAIAKIAFEGCAIAIGNKAICEPAFDLIRNWILDGARRCDELKGEEVHEVANCCNHDYRSEIWLGLPVLDDAPFQHRIFAVSGPAVKGAWAAIELFGSLRFTVVLCEEEDIAEGRFGYLVDPLSGREERMPSFESIAPASFVSEHRLDIEASRRAFETLTASVYAHIESDMRQEIVKGAFERAFPAEGEMIERHHIAAFARQVAEEVVRHQFRIDTEEPITLQEIFESEPENNKGNGS